MLQKDIIKQEDNFSEWYSSLLNISNFVHYSPIKGMVIYSPTAWQVWQNIQKEIDRRFATIGIVNIQLPLLIKQSEFNKEKQHIEGFKAELYTITHQGDEKLDEPLVLRPTSEIAFCNYFKQILQNYKQLPLKYNQWCSVYRCEKNTRPFLRTCEFFWQELHTLHASEQEAKQTASDIMNVYADLLKYFFCIPAIIGEKTENERFAGANITLTAEALMQDGQALQCATSHYLATNFSSIFGIKFQDKDNLYKTPLQTSAGISTRIIGAIILSHADNKGLVWPIGVAPCQIAIIVFNPKQETLVIESSDEIYKTLKNNYRVIIDTNNESIGGRIANYEVQGVPIVIVIGHNDAVNKKCTIIRRDNGNKSVVDISDIKSQVEKQLHDFNIAIYNKAFERTNNSIVECNNIDDAIKYINDKKMVIAPWGGNDQDEKQLKAKYGITPRCIKQEINNQQCFYTKKPASKLVYFARAY